MTTTTNNTFSHTILSVSRVRNDGYGRTLNAVVFRLDDIAAPGCDIFAPGAPRRVVELSSFDGNAVDVYVEDPETGIRMHHGTIADYTPPARRGEGSIFRTFAKVWFATQKSARCRRAFEASCA